MSIQEITYNIMKGRSLPDADKMYLKYLQEHREGVVRAFIDILYPRLVEDGVIPAEMIEIGKLIDTHDESKYSVEEFGPYRDYFYDKEANPRSSQEFTLAWLHHQNRNPHHWQYWVLINDQDTPQVQAVDMPFKYIIEMLCDWQSAGNHYGNTAYDWWIKQQDKFIMTEYTKSIVERYIVYFK